MIKATELRIGNLLIDNWPEQGPIVATVKSIDEQGCVWVEDETFSWGHRKSTEVEYIPLTTEWLDRFNFEIKVHEKGIKYIAINNFLWLLVIDGAVPHLVLASAEIMHDLQTRVQYVHQLQNLYFALSGEELTIKETV